MNNAHETNYLVGLVSTSMVAGKTKVTSTSAIERSIAGYIVMTSEEIESLETMCADDQKHYNDQYSLLADEYHMIGAVRDGMVYHFDQVNNSPLIMERYAMSNRKSSLNIWNVATSPDELEDLLSDIWEDEESINVAETIELTEKEIKTAQKEAVKTEKEATELEVSAELAIETQCQEFAEIMIEKAIEAREAADLVKIELAQLTMKLEALRNGTYVKEEIFIGDTDDSVYYGTDSIDPSRVMDTRWVNRASYGWSAYTAIGAW